MNTNNANEKESRNVAQAPEHDNVRSEQTKDDTTPPPGSSFCGDLDYVDPAELKYKEKNETTPKPYKVNWFKEMMN